MGSGSLNAMAVFEDGYKEDLSREEVQASPASYALMHVHVG
jgi:20S proteasome alpha/beta subunit